MAKAKNPVKGKVEKALAQHAQDETSYGQEFIDLPPGIQGGVATLVEAKFGAYKSGTYEGEQFVYLAGVVVEPIHYTYNPKVFIGGKIETQDAVTVKVQGQRTSLMIPWCETTNSQGKVTTVEEHVEDALNRLRQLGADTSEVKTEQDMEAIMDALVGVGPVFKFGTRSSTPNAQYPESRTWESWYGDEGLEDHESPDEEEVVDDTEEPDEDLNQGDEDSDELEEDEDNNEGPSLEELADLADIEETDPDGTQESIAQLTAMCEPLGIDPDDYESWTDVVVDIKEKVETSIAEENEEGGEGEDSTPEVGEAWEYKPPKKRSFVDVLVTKVFSRKKTVDLKNLEDGKTLYKGVPWDKLQLADED